MMCVSLSSYSARLPRPDSLIAQWASTCRNIELTKSKWGETNILQFLVQWGMYDKRGRNPQKCKSETRKRPPDGHIQLFEKASKRNTVYMVRCIELGLRLGKCIQWKRCIVTDGPAMYRSLCLPLNHSRFCGTTFPISGTTRVPTQIHQTRSQNNVTNSKKQETCMRFWHVPRATKTCWELRFACTF